MRQHAFGQWPRSTPRPARSHDQAGFSNSGKRRRWRGAADCKSVLEKVRWFESILPHQYMDEPRDPLPQHSPLALKHVRVDGEFVSEAAGVELLARKDGSGEGIVWFKDGEGNSSRLFGSGICYVMNASGSTVATYYTFADPEGAVQDEFGNFAAEATAEHGPA